MGKEQNNREILKSNNNKSSLDQCLLYAEES